MFRPTRILGAVGIVVLLGVGVFAIAEVVVQRGPARGDTARRFAPDSERESGHSPQPINVLLISLDTTRKDRLSCYGYWRETTPHIDALAADGLRFDRCVAVSNWTLPTHASMLGGLYPAAHGAFGRKRPLPRACRTLAEVLQEAAYRTGAVVANHGWLNRALRLDQGFDHYDDRRGEPPSPYRAASQIADAAVAWLEQDRSRPFFLFLNLLDPHEPYFPRPSIDAEFADAPESSGPDSADRHWQFWRDVQEHVHGNRHDLLPDSADLLQGLYDSELAYLDEQVGRLLGWLRSHGLYDRTLVVLTSDHGQSLGEHRKMGHALSLYEPEVAVPMILKLPFGRRKGVVDYGVQHVDIMPTVLEVLDLPAPRGLHGVSMLEPEARYLVTEDVRFRKQWALYWRSLKYVRHPNGTEQLFDLDRDPEELDDAAALLKDDLQMLQDAMAAWRAGIEPLAPDEPAEVPFAPDHLRQLRDLGYVQ